MANRRDEEMQLGLAINRALMAGNTTELFDKLGDFMSLKGMVASKADVRNIPVAR